MRVSLLHGRNRRDDHCGRRECSGHLRLRFATSTALGAAAADRWIDDHGRLRPDDCPGVDDDGTGGAAGYITLVAVLMFVASFAMSMGPVTWVLIGELFPPEMRDKAMSLALVRRELGNQPGPLCVPATHADRWYRAVFAGFAVINFARYWCSFCEAAGHVDSRSPRLVR